MVTRLNTFLAEVCSQHGPEQMKTSEHNNNRIKKKQEKHVQKYYYAAERDNNICMRSPRCVSCTCWSHFNRLSLLSTNFQKNSVAVQELLPKSASWCSSASSRHSSGRGLTGGPRGSKTPSQKRTAICSRKYGCQDHGRHSNTSREQAGQVKDRRQKEK